VNSPECALTYVTHRAQTSTVPDGMIPGNFSIAFVNGAWIEVATASGLFQCVVSVAAVNIIFSPF